MDCKNYVFSGSPRGTREIYSPVTRVNCSRLPSPCLTKFTVTCAVELILSSFRSENFFFVVFQSVITYLKMIVFILMFMHMTLLQ